MDTLSSTKGARIYNELKTISLTSGAGKTSQFSSVAQSCLTLCNPMNRSMPGLPVHHHLPEFTQTHVHRVRDAIQPSPPLFMGFSRQKYQSGLPFPSPWDLPDPGIKPMYLH